MHNPDGYNELYMGWKLLIHWVDKVSSWREMERVIRENDPNDAVASRNYKPRYKSPDVAAIVEKSRSERVAEHKGQAHPVSCKNCPGYWGRVGDKIHCSTHGDFNLGDIKLPGCYSQWSLI